MSPLATVIVMLAAVDATTAVFYLMHSAQRRAEAEHTALAALMLCASFSSLGTVLIIETSDLRLGRIGLDVWLMTTMVAPSLLVQAQQALTKDRAPLLLGTSRALALVGLGLIAAGSILPAPEASSGVPWGFGWVPTYLHRAITPPIQAAFNVLAPMQIAIQCYAMVRMTLHSLRDASVRAMTIVLGIAWAACTLDVTARLVFHRMLFVLDVGTFVAAIAASRIMLLRFIRSGEALNERARLRAQTRMAMARTERALLQKRQLAAIGELSAVIAHEVRNPLAIIKNAVCGLRRTPAGLPDATELLRILNEETARLRRLVTDLSNYARPLAPQAQPLDLLKVLEAAEAQLRAVGDARPRRKLHTESPLPHCWVLGDADLLRLALANVIENGLHATAQDEDIAVRVSQSEPWGRVVVEVRDRGRGMPPAVLAKATHPFFTTRPTGTGLGLAIVERVVKAHGGLVEIESQPERGTCVRLVLPAARAPTRELLEDDQQPQWA